MAADVSSIESDAKRKDGVPSTGRQSAYGTDRWLMSQALTAARLGLGLTAPNPSVGAAIFNREHRRLIGRGTTAVGGRPHAEPMAIAAAGALSIGATMAVTLEPCSHHGRSPPCVDAIRDAKLARVIIGAVDPDPRVAGRGVDQLRASGIDVSFCDPDQAAEARWITRGHILRVTERRPLIQVKIAVGPDGRIAEGAAGQATWVTGTAARQRGHLMRAMADAILIGSRTAVADNPDLTCRLPGLADRSPIRVVVRDRALSQGTRLMATAGSVPTFRACSGSLSAAEAAAGVQRVHVPKVSGRLWLPTLMNALAPLEVTRLLVEGGPSMWRSFAEASLIDEVVLFHARAGEDQPTARQAADEAIGHYLERTDLQLRDWRPIGGDDMFTYRMTEAQGWTERGSNA